MTASANDFTVASNKKTIMPADVFKALDETEFGFMRERLEAEFASMFTLAYLYTSTSTSFGDLRG